MSSRCWRPSSRRRRPLPRHPPHHRLGRRRPRSAIPPTARRRACLPTRRSARASPSSAGSASPSTPGSIIRRSTSSTDLARAFPDTKIVLNHVGGPLGIGAYAGKRDEVFPAWAASIKALAACPNVCVKLGGLGMRMDGFGFHEQPEPPSSETLAAAWRPYVETCIEAFGASRCMFESNFPVDKGSYSYPVFWNACKRLAKGASKPRRPICSPGPPRASIASTKLVEVLSSDQGSERQPDIT